MAHDLARFVIVAFLLVVLGPMACGGSNSSSVGGGSGSAVSLGGSFKGVSFTAKDAASVVLPASASLTKSVLAIIYSDTPGVCEQANTTINANSTFFLAILVDETGSAAPPTGSYVLNDPSTQNPVYGDSDSGFALLFGEHLTDSVYADGGTVTISFSESSQVGGTTSGSLSATIAGASIISGKFEAPECDALGPWVQSALGL